MINYPLYDAIRLHEKSRLHKRAAHASAREQPMQSSPKAQVYIELTHYASLCMDVECKLFFMTWKCNVQRFFNYHVTLVETFIKHNIECAWLVNEIKAYSRPIY